MQFTLQSPVRLHYLHADGYCFPATWVYPENSAPYSMLRFIQNGSARFVVDQKEYTAEKGSIVYIPEGSRFSCEALAPNFTFVSVHFTSSILLRDGETHILPLGIQPITPCDSSEISRCFDGLMGERSSSRPGRYFRLQGYLEMIIGYLIDKSKESGALKIIDEREACLPAEQNSASPAPFQVEHTPARQDMRIQAVIEHLAADPGQKVDIAKLCRMVNLSESSLRRLFKAQTGKSPIEFLCSLRMAYAARMILESKERISAIAGRLGFEDSNYFARRFKRIYGISPMQYRMSARRR